jgi:hypothetical protein
MQRTEEEVKMKTRIVSAIAVVLAVGTLLLAPVYQARADEHSDIAKLITTAKTAADHQAIADHYSKMAAEAKEKAKEHEVMGAAYKQAGGAAIGKWHLDSHCETISKDAAAEAAQYEKLAEAHRQMAKAVK